MADIIVCYGLEKKKVCGVNHLTTCKDVIQTLLKDPQTFNNLKIELKKEVKNLSFLSADQLQNIATNFVLYVGDFFGNEVPLQPQTKITFAWQEWGVEIGRVRFSLKKDKRSSEINTNLSNRLSDLACAMKHNHFHQQHPHLHQFLQSHSDKQIKHLCRCLTQHRQARLYQQMITNTDTNNNPNKVLTSSDFNTEKPPSLDKTIPNCIHSHRFAEATVTLSEEIYVDGVHNNSDCEIIENAENRYILAKEHCTYRRPHHWRKTCLNERDRYPLQPTQNRSECFHRSQHIKSKRRSVPRRRSSKTKSHRRHVSQQVKRYRSSHLACRRDSSSTATLNSDSENEKCKSGEEADDEKSIMTENGLIVSRRKRLACPNNLPPSADELLSTSNIVIMDLSATSSSDTSNTSSSSLSGTSSSETSTSSADLYEAFCAKQMAASVAAQLKPSPKPKTVFQKLRKFAKPAQNLISSYKNKEKALHSAKQVHTFISTNKSQKLFQNQKSQGNLEIPTGSTSVTSRSLLTTSERSDEIVASAKTASSTDENEIDHEGNLKCNLDQLCNLVMSQEYKLKDLCRQTYSVNTEIDEIETQIHKWQTQTCGENYVQDIYLSGLNGATISDTPIKSTKKRLICSDWLYDCNDVQLLQEFVSYCENVVSKQMDIEECKRLVEIITQDIEDEVWKLSNDPRMSNQAKNVIESVLNLAPNDEHSSFMTRNKSSQLNDFVNTQMSAASDNVELQQTKNEFELNLDLHRRLTSELDEICRLMTISWQLVQSKGESLLDLIRELAQSDEGISPELWNEYGDLLIAYDAEVSTALIQINGSQGTDMNEMLDANKKEISTLVQNKTDSGQHENILDDEVSLFDWSEQRELDYQRSDVAEKDSHVLTPLNPKCPSTTSGKDKKMDNLSSTILLPMPPIDTIDDNDYEDISTNEKATRAKKNRVLTSNFPLNIALNKHDNCVKAQLNSTNITLKQNETNNTDDSGNASAGSTSSGSPRPSSVCPDSAQTSPLFFGCQNKTGHSCSRFQFPVQHADKDSIQLPGNFSSKPPVPVKSPTVLSAAALLVERNSKLSTKDRLRLGALTRCNSSRAKRTALLDAPDWFSRRANSFGKGNVNLRTKPNLSQYPLEHQQSNRETFDQNITSNAYQWLKNQQENWSLTNVLIAEKPTPQYLLPACEKSSFQNSSSALQAMASKNKFNVSSRNSTSTCENDSDTGLSSMYSADSFDRLNTTVGETLV